MMDERLQELVRKVKLSNPNLIWSWAELERFAELVRQDERIAMLQKITGRENQPSEFGTVTVEYMERQIARERESNARLCNVHECRRKVREADDDSSLAGSPIYRR
jgi:hypothetical protein